jgi:hypothetical protein
MLRFDIVLVEAVEASDNAPDQTQLAWLLRRLLYHGISRKRIGLMIAYRPL